MPHLFKSPSSALKWLPPLLGLLLFLANLPLQAEGKSPYAGKKALFLLGEQEYGTPESLPAFARAQLAPLGIDLIIVPAASNDRSSPLCHTFDGLEAIESADILILSTRRRFPKTENLAKIRKFIESGKPVIGVRTASHGFAEKENGIGYRAPEGHSAWNSFDVDVLGARYLGHDPNRRGKPRLIVEAHIESSALDHPLVKKLNFTEPFLIDDKVYKYTDLDPAVQVLLRARYKNGEPERPIAWTNEEGGKRVFYMSPCGLDDMSLPQIQSLLKAAILWGLDGE